jgi:hypothetical protein
MPKNRSIARRTKVLRRLVGDSTVDRALKDVYDRIDDLQPSIEANESPLVRREDPIGSTMLVQNYEGDDSLAIKTKSGWKVDMNSKLSPAMKGYRPSVGLKSMSPHPVEGEALLYQEI